MQQTVHYQTGFSPSETASAQQQPEQMPLLREELEGIPPKRITTTAWRVSPHKDRSQAVESLILHPAL